nr:pentatricopeptide repeat protein AaPPR313 [Agave angustifolia]UPT49327.1 pentatricopeptide repeat protein AaPPR240 [Agave angustifolia]UPT49356.1 pentatricopeptide repeat protein AaPPR304 [Agave angustifolia]UPT49787.1 pentatricopeptide repeat protein AaPPR1444 [Agave angustifolia]
MMKAFGRAGKVNEVVRLLREMKWSSCEPNVLCYNTVMNAFVMANRPKEAKVVFKEMITLGIVPNVSSYNILVKMYCHLEQLDSVKRVIKGMTKCGCKPDSNTYSTWITGLCWAGTNKEEASIRKKIQEEAWGVLDLMFNDKCSPTVHAYTPIVHSYCLEGKIQEAKDLMAIMEYYGCPPSSVTYNVLINGLCKIGDFDAVEQVIRESGLKGWKPNVDTYTTYMNGLCKSGKTKEAIELFETMKGNGFDPTIISLSICLDCLFHDSKIWEAKCLLDCVGVAGYNTLLSRLSKLASWLEVLSLFTNMLKKGITPNTRTFNIVINSLCKGGKLLKAKCIFNSRRFLPSIVTYNTLIHWCYQNGEKDEAQLLLSRMNVEKIAYDAITYSIMCKGENFSEATNYFLRSLQYKFDQDLALGLINRLHDRGRFKELKQLLEGMKTLCIERSCQSLEILCVCDILYKMLKKK